MRLEKYTVGVGDRFGQQGKAQLKAFQQAREAGWAVCPVWNKSNREHGLIGTRSESVRQEADEAVRALGWTSPYYVDADHINRQNVDSFLAASDFFTIDVADFIGQRAESAAVEAFVQKQADLVRRAPVPVSAEMIRATAEHFLLAVQEAGRIYRYIEAQKGRGRFVTEVSMDETVRSQTPAELLLILAMIAEEGIPAETVAPKFTGEFHKGVDYQGDPDRFEADFDQHLTAISYARTEWKLPETLKLSIHSGSDKFSLYPRINRQLKKHQAGVHLKTAGTTWLEEIHGLAAAGGEALTVAREIYVQAYGRYAELIKPYATVVAIDRTRLPLPEQVRTWSSAAYVGALVHDQKNPAYQPNFRQFLHLSFRVAAEMGDRYLALLREHQDEIGRRVTDNLFQNHLRPLWS